ncbi:MAG: hypothetical protein HRT45_08650 [Bdellovibrionales bacterium]|nr:hypothetical protein [Bdellovibrionales bacterium]
MANLDAIAEFEDKVAHLYESEYGDFKRKLGLYMSRLEQDLGASLDRSMKAKLLELKFEIVYSPETTNIESARSRALEVVRSLKS